MRAVNAEVASPGGRVLRKPVNCEHLLTIKSAALRETDRIAHGNALDERTSSAPFMG